MFLDRRWIGFVALLAAVVYLTVVPILIILYGTLQDGAPGTDTSFTLGNYIQAYSDPELIELATNSVIFALGSAILSFVLGTYLAWVTERTNTPFKGIIYVFVLFPFVVPGILSTIAWVFLLSPKIGLINWLFVQVLGFPEPPFNIYSMWGMIWVFGVDNITLPFFLMAASFRSMDPSLEEAAHVSGMGPISAFWHVNLKLMIPTILAVWLLLFVRGIETFEAPAVIGIPAEVKVFATQIFLALTVSAPPQYNLAGTYATLYLIITVAGVMFYLRATSVSERYTTITGKGYRPRVQNLGPWRYVTLAISLVLLFTVVLLPTLMISWTSFLPFYAQPSSYLVSLLSLQNYSSVFRMDIFHRALINNAITGGASSTIAVLFAASISWIVIRTNIAGRKLLDILAFTPIAIPGVVMGLALIWVYLTLPIPVYGTLWILIIGYVTKYTPIALRACHASILQVHSELEEASEISGSSWSRTFFHILLPLILPGLLVGWFYVLTLTFRVLSLPVLLSHVGTEVFPMVIYDLYNTGNFGELSALGIILIGLLTVIAAVSRFISGRFGVQEA